MHHIQLKMVKSMNELLNEGTILFVHVEQIDHHLFRRVPFWFKLFKSEQLGQCACILGAL